MAIPGVFLTPFVGLLSDRFGRRRVLAASLASFAVSGVGGAFAPNYSTLLALRILMGVPYAGLLALTPVILTDLFRGPIRSRAIGLNTAALTIAGTLGPIAGGYLASAYGSQAAFLVYFSAMPVLILTRWLRLDGTVRAARTTRARSLWGELRSEGRLPDLLGSMPYTTVFTATFVGFCFVIVPLFLESEFRIDVAGRGPAVGAANLGSALASFAFSRYATRLRPRFLLQTGQALALTALLLLMSASAVPVVILGVCLLGAAMGTTLNTMQVFVAAASPIRHRGVIAGTWSASQRIGQVAGGPLVGLLVLAVGSRPAFLVGAIIIMVVAGTWLPLRHYLLSREPRLA